MKTLHKIVSIGLLSIGAVAMAGSVTIPNTFEANTTAKAAEVNANFSAVKSAVNDNDNRIVTNKNDIQTNTGKISANESVIDGKVDNVTASGGVVATRTNNDIAIKLKSGYIAVHGSQFNSLDERDNRCVLIRSEIGAFFSNSSINGCKAYASVAVPSSAKLTKFICRVKHNDNTGGGDMVIRLHQRYIKTDRSTFPPTKSFKTHEAATLTFDTTNSNYKVKSADITNGIPHIHPILSYGASSYVIEYEPNHTTNASQNEMLYDCFVEYTY